MSSESNPSPPVFPAEVLQVLDDDFEVAINRGKQHGLKIGQRLLVYGLSKESFRDPQTNEDLGLLEIVRGTGTVTHVQEKMCTLRSDRKSQSTRRTLRRPTFLEVQETEVYSDVSELPFKDPVKGDKVRPA